MNTLYQGDNLSILREMPDASVDLIATDPPFNTGKDWGAFSDKWEGGLKGYLKFMEARAVEMHRVLKPTGSLYLHCDPTASHYLKVMLDGVFGIKQFRNEIVWSYKSMSVVKRDFPRKHDIILRYTKSKTWVFNLQRQPYNPKSLEIFKRGGRFYNNEPYDPHPDGMLIPSVWDIPMLNSMAKERTDHPTQKPRALYERIIKASSNQGDTVLDPFAGSGTTLDAAQTLGRKWIGIDIGDEAITTIEKRLCERHGLLLEYELISD